MRFWIALIFVFGISSTCAYAQWHIALSSKHEQKLSTIKSGHKRLAKFYKYYRRDSIKHIKKGEQHFKDVIDSAYNAERKQERLERRLSRRGIAVPKQLSNADEIDFEIKKALAVVRDSSSSDSLKQVAKNTVRTLAIEKAKSYPGFQHLSDQYQSGDSINWDNISKQVPGLDTLQGLFNSSPTELFSQAEKLSESKLLQSTKLNSLSTQLADVEKLKALPDQYKGEYGKYADKEAMEREGKQKAVSEAVDYFAEHADKLQSAHAKVGKLLSKYRDFQNSADLKTAVKQTSMKGKTSWERIVASGNFNVVSLTPFSIDLSPQVGYKFNEKFFAGLGLNYRYAFSDSIKNGWYISPRNTGFKAFVNYDLIKNFYAYAEWQKSNVKIKTDDGIGNAWKDNYFIGAGKRLLIHPKLYMTVTALYNLNSESRNPISTNRFQIRTGFQLSDLATRKKKVYYDPNR